jgi:hypothetical protein
MRLPRTHDPQEARRSIQRPRNLGRPATVVASFSLSNCSRRAGLGREQLMHRCICTTSTRNYQAEGALHPRLACDRSVDLVVVCIADSLGTESQTTASQDHHASCTHTHHAYDRQTDLTIRWQRLLCVRIWKRLVSCVARALLLRASCRAMLP